MSKAIVSPPTKKIKANDVKFEDHAINVIRMLSADQPSAGNSGHPGAPIGCAPMAHVLYHKIMNYNPNNPTFCNRDRFVLSNGHACALQYSMLHLTGFNVSLEDLKNFRQWNSKTPGHPENTVTPGIELTTGPLGQGISNAVGLAIAEKHLAAEFNKKDEFENVVNHFTYVICGDGCLQEGVSSEASSLAGHLGLGKLIVLYDDNKITIDGETKLSFTEDVVKRYEAYGWHVQVVEDGRYDHEAIHQAILKAKKVTDKPSLIKIYTVIGLNSVLQNTGKVHGTPLTAEDLANTKKKFGLDGSKMFQIPEEVAKFYDHKAKGKDLENSWNEMFKKYSTKYPALANDFNRRKTFSLPANWKDSLPRYTPEDKSMATRKFSELALNSVASKLPELVGGSADLTPSTLTQLTMSGDFQKDTPIGRYLRFGVREHGMAAICNGIFGHGLLRPFCATFLNFIGYALGAVRLSAISEFGVLYIATHDSVFLGEDGPTHQPIEMIPSLRAIPNMYVYRPADGNEVSGAYICAIENSKTKPAVFALSRQNVPNLRGSSVEKVSKGAYIIQSIENGKAVNVTFEKPDVIIIATGSEVSMAIDAAKALGSTKARVISMPCRELFEEQVKEYKKSLLVSGVPVISVEAGSTCGWDRYSHFQFGIDTFGASANIEQLKSGLKFDVKDLVADIKSVLSFYSKGKIAHDLVDVPVSSRKISKLH